MTEIRTDARITFTNEEMFTAEEIQFLRLATAALEWMGKQEMLEEDYTETAEMVVVNAPVVMRKLNRLLNSEEEDKVELLNVIGLDPNL